MYLVNDSKRFYASLGNTDMWLSFNMAISLAGKSLPTK